MAILMGRFQGLHDRLAAFEAGLEERLNALRGELVDGIAAQTSQADDQSARIEQASESVISALAAAEAHLQGVHDRIAAVEARLEERLNGLRTEWVEVLAAHASRIEDQFVRIDQNAQSVTKAVAAAEARLAARLEVVEARLEGLLAETPRETALRARLVELELRVTEGFALLRDVDGAPCLPGGEALDARLRQIEAGLGRVVKQLAGSR